MHGAFRKNWHLADDSRDPVPKVACVLPNMKATEPKTADQVASQPDDSGWKCSSSTPFWPKQVREPGLQPQTFAVMVKVRLFTHEADAKLCRSAQKGIRVELLGGAVSGDGLARHPVTCPQGRISGAATDTLSAFAMPRREPTPQCSLRLLILL